MSTLQEGINRRPTGTGDTQSNRSIVRPSKRSKRKQRRRVQRFLIAARLGRLDFFFRLDVKYLVAAWFVVAIAYAVFQAIRPEPISHVQAGGIIPEYVPANYPLWVYHSSASMRLRSSPNFGTGDNVTGELSKGDLFYMNNEEQSEVIRKNWNYPKNNVSRYRFQYINVFKDGNNRKNQIAAVSEAFYLTDKDEEPNQYNRIHEKGFLLVRSLPLIDFIISELKRNGWNGKESFTAGNFSFVKGGYYGIKLTKGVNLYSAAGDRIGHIDKGSVVYANYAAPFATGQNNPNLVRIVGFSTAEIPKKVEAKGLYFIPLFDDKGNYNFAAINTKNK